MGARTVQVGVRVGQDSGYGRDVLRGVIRFSRERPEWRVRPVGKLPSASSGTNMDGAIVQLSAASLIYEAEDFQRPLVNVSNALPPMHFPRVGTNDSMAGEMAAEHFLASGFRHFLYVGIRVHPYSEARLAGFRRALNAAGLDCAVVYRGENKPTLAEALQILPRPLAIFVCNDSSACYVTEAATRLRLRIPDETAVLGVDNDTILCDCSVPPLSSVDISAEDIGFEAARVLDGLLRGAAAPTEPTLVPPRGVVVRKSTDYCAIPDADVRLALEYIQRHAGQRIGVDDLLGAVPVGRRTLERKFRAALSRSPREEIERVQINRAKELLSSTDLAIAEIAQQTGSGSMPTFSARFRQVVGMTPSDYRRQFSARVTG